MGWFKFSDNQSETIEALKEAIRRALLMGPLTSDGIERMVSHNEPFPAPVQRAFRLAFKKMRTSGEIVEGEDGEYRLSAGYSTPKVNTPIPDNAPESIADISVMPEWQRKKELDNLLDRYSDTEDAEEKQILERKMRELRASFVGWLKK